MSTAALWWVTLVVGLVVVVVVALLLAAVIATARRIRGVVAEIWVVGPEIAHHTAHLDVVRRINLVAADLIDDARAAARDARRLREHAGSCPRCPECVGGGGGVGVPV